jgi:hypothetical protein
VALTWADTPQRAATTRCYASSMQIAHRDLAVIRLVGRFQQLTSAQISTAIFHEKRSKTSSTNVLRRLVRDRYLAHLNRPLPGGPQGGRGQYVYQIGPEGWKLFSRSRWRPSSSVNFHSLAIGDVYMQALQIERAGHGSISSYLTEPESHVVIARQDLRPDLHLELEVPGRGVLSLYIEVDLATERQKQLREKMERYYQAWKHTDADSFPLIVFLAPDEYRRAEIRRIVGAGGEEWTALFHVELQSDFAAYLDRTING